MYCETTGQIQQLIQRQEKASEREDEHNSKKSKRQSQLQWAYFVFMLIQTKSLDVIRELLLIFGIIIDL